MTEIAFVGLGNMGRPMARNLVKAGHSVTGFDTMPDNLKGAAGDGVKPAASTAAAVAGAELVVTMLPAGRHVREVYGGEGGILGAATPGALLVDSSTIDVETARTVAGSATVAGFQMLDAPVSGGVTGADAGGLTFMVGGDAAAYRRAEPVLSCMGKTIVHAGAAGAGQAAKICNNMVLGISMIAASEAFALADRLGLDRQKLFDISSQSSGQCWALTSYCPVPGPVPSSPANRDYQPGFTAAMMLKDLKLAQEAAHTVGAATPLGAEAAALYALFCNGGEADRDFSGIFKMISGQ
ncbi:MAG: 3-hydroxyisobutyrate dehydrogenase [Inquilinus sp.]|nr:3-hydroxyisobutyrate dehydrogenase [Inquilinus sp.]